MFALYHVLDLNLVISFDSANRQLKLLAKFSCYIVRASEIILNPAHLYGIRTHTCTYLTRERYSRFQLRVTHVFQYKYLGHIHLLTGGAVGHTC